MRNQFKYRCADCGWTGFFRLNEFARRCRPRCGACGSTLLDPVTAEANARIRLHDHEQVEAHDRAAVKQGFAL
jgi:hypothetical protein